MIRKIQNCYRQYNLPLKIMRDLQSYCKILISLISKSKNVTMSLRIVDSNSRNFIRNTFLR
ncbi:hypothetical protein, partial [Helicobacter sp. 12S02232-10]|uniref:hypothetical protein n=1 Tax=Helicobacter sp. 12S02232-10 TaxID=1476197 RepID=UPI001C5F01B5